MKPIAGLRQHTNRMSDIKLIAATILLCVSVLMNCENAVDVYMRKTRVEMLLVENGDIETRVRDIGDALKEINEVTGANKDDNYIEDDEDGSTDEMLEESSEPKYTAIRIQQDRNMALLNTHL